MLGHPATPSTTVQWRTILASNKLHESEVTNAIARLANLQGVLTCAVMVMDEEVSGSPLWEVSEAIRGAIEMARESFCTLNDSSVSFTVGGARIGEVVTGDEAELVKAWRACSVENRTMFLDDMRELAMPKAA